MACSRCRVGWWEFSARLFRYCDCRSSAEDGAGWLAFFRDLIARDLSGVALVTSDARPGLVAAIGAHPARGGLAALQNALHGQLDVGHPEVLLAAGEASMANPAYDPS